MSLRAVTPRYIRCTLHLDCRMSPQAYNSVPFPCFQKGMRLGYLRVPPMMMANIYNHLKCGIASPHGGTTRLEFRYCTPRLADALNGLNDFNWAWFDTSGTRCQCTSRINGTMPYDTNGDAIFVVDMQKVQNDCYILWYDKTNDLVFCDLGGLEPQYILGCIDTSSNTVVLKNAQTIEDMKVRYAESVRYWKETRHIRRTVSSRS